jgi:hypothetical protein
MRGNDHTIVLRTFCKKLYMHSLNERRDSARRDTPVLSKIFFLAVISEIMACDALL